MKCSVTGVILAVLAVILTVSIGFAPNAFAQNTTSFELPKANERSQADLQAAKDKAALVAGIVQRWENQVKASRRWDSNPLATLTGELMKSRLETLVLAGQASSFEEMMEIAALGQPLERLVKSSPSRLREIQMIPPVVRTLAAGDPSVLGSITGDMVYTPITPCRIVDSRNALGPLSAMVARGYDVDNATSNTSQGGVSGTCGIPNGVARAVAMTITVTNPSGPGWLSAWALGQPWPGTSSINYATGETIANTAIVPVVPGAGNDFNVMSYAPTQVIIDVSGYFAPPVATALDCNTQSLFGTGTSNVTNGSPFSIPNEALCTAGYAAVSTMCGYNLVTPPAGLYLTVSGGIEVQGGPSYSWACNWLNQTGSTLNGSDFYTMTRCCRIPGR